MAQKCSKYVENLRIIMNHLESKTDEAAQPLVSCVSSGTPEGCPFRTSKLQRDDPDDENHTGAQMWVFHGVSLTVGFIV